MNLIVADQTFLVRLAQSIYFRKYLFKLIRSYIITIYKTIFISHKMNLPHVALANMTDDIKQ